MKSVANLQVRLNKESLAGKLSYPFDGAFCYISQFTVALSRKLVTLFSILNR